MHPTLVLFDLDGTLVDTAPDLAYALNLQRQLHGLAAMPENEIRPYASHGSTGLLKVGFGIDKQHPEFADYVSEYLSLYGQVFDRDPQLFGGMQDLLNSFAQQNILWGVVTNKHRQFSQPLMSKLGLSEQCACLICGDDVSQPKPSPEGLLTACDKLGFLPKDTVYVGDAERDIQAGKEAGMRTVIAMYGYLSEQDMPQQWLADNMIYQPQELGLLI